MKKGQKLDKQIPKEMIAEHYDFFKKIEKIPKIINISYATHNRLFSAGNNSFEIDAIEAELPTEELVFKFDKKITKKEFHMIHAQLVKEFNPDKAVIRFDGIPPTIVLCEIPLYLRKLIDKRKKV